MVENKRAYGDGDASYCAAGKEQGIRQLVDDFYQAMCELPEAADIRAMHADDLTEAREKLAVFLTGWLGGPRTYAERFGKIHIPATHAHIPIGIAERDAWMACMEVAVAKQANFAADFKRYFLAQIAVPAERVRNKE